MEIEVTEPSLANAHCIGQHGLKHRLKLARRTADDLQHLGGCRLLLQRLGEFLFQVGVGCANAVNVSSRLRCLRTKTGHACSALHAFASQDHLVGTVIGRVSSLSILIEPHDELAPLYSITSSALFAERDLWNILGGLLRFDVGGTYHLAPLLGFICDELAEVGRRAGKCAGSEFGNSRLDLKIGKSSVNFLVELEHDFGGYIFRRGDTEPRIGLITRQEFGYGWNVWQIAPTLACRNRQCAQRSALDVLHRGNRPKEGNLHPAAKQISIRSARAPVGYMQQVDAGRQLE